MSAERLKVLVKEKLADSGVNLLREHFDVDLRRRPRRPALKRRA